MRYSLDKMLAAARRLRAAVQDAGASVLLCVLVVALIFGSTPPRFLLDPLLDLAAPAPASYNVPAPTAVAGAPELDDAPSVEVASAAQNRTATTVTGSAVTTNRRAKNDNEAVTLADEGKSGEGPSRSSGVSTGAAAPPSPSPIGPCTGSASANSTKHANSSGLDNGTGHGCR